jgi:hypothetical protein
MYYKLHVALNPASIFSWPFTISSLPSHAVSCVKIQPEGYRGWYSLTYHYAIVKLVGVLIFFNYIIAIYSRI